MEAVAIKEKAKSLIDTLDDEQTQLVINYAESLEKKNEPKLSDLFRKYRGKLDLDIDLDALRGRNDPR